MFKQSSQLKIGDFVKSKFDDSFYGYVTYIDLVAGTGEYYVEVVYDVDADPLYFYEDELQTIKLIKE